MHSRTIFQQTFSCFCLLMTLFTCRGCQFGSSEEACTYICHCADGTTCDSQTGACMEGCDPGLASGITSWSGPGCQIGNVAFEKSVTITPQQLADATHAVDESLTSCAISFSFDTSNPMVALEIDLFDMYLLQNIIIYADELMLGSAVEGRTDFSNSYQLCASLEASNMEEADDNNKFTLYCNSQMAVRYLRLIGGATHSYMQVCEVIVYGYLFRNCPLGYYGPGCLLECPCDQETCTHPPALDINANCPQCLCTTSPPTSAIPTTTTTGTMSPIPTTTTSVDTTTHLHTTTLDSTTVISTAAPSTPSITSGIVTRDHPTRPPTPDDIHTSPPNTASSTIDPFFPAFSSDDDTETMTIVYSVVSAIFAILVIVCIIVITILCRGIKLGYEEYQPSLDDASTQYSSTVFDAVRDPSPGRLRTM